MKKRLSRATIALAFAVCLHGCKGKSGGSEGAPGSSAANLPTGANPLAMLNGFEGQIDLAIKDMSKGRAGSPEVVPISLQIKNEKVRVEMPQAVASKPMPKGYAVLSAPEKKLSIVMDDQKQIVVLDLNKAGEQLKSFGAGLPKGPKEKSAEGPSKPLPKLTKTGVTDKVAGIACENWEVTEESRKMATLCIADQGASWLRLPLTGIPTEYAWATELLDGKHFPLRVIGYDKKTGAEEARIELTKLEKKPIAASLFDMPAGYKIVDLGAMLGQFAGPQGPGQFGGLTRVGGLPAAGPLPPRKPK
jgi:hypothetical protein